jgi:hypothetical protein
MQKLWINKKNKQFIRVRGINDLPQLERAEILYTFYDKVKKIKIMIIDIESSLFILSLMNDGKIEQGELIKIPSINFGEKMIQSFKGYIYGTTTN